MKTQEQRIIGLENQIKNLIEELETLVDLKEIPKIIKAGIIQQIQLSRKFIEKEEELEKAQQQKMIEQMQLFEQLEVMFESGNSINPDSVIRSAIQLVIGKKEETF